MITFLEPEKSLALVEVFPRSGRDVDCSVADCRNLMNVSRPRYVDKESPDGVSDDQFCPLKAHLRELRGGNALGAAVRSLISIVAMTDGICIAGPMAVASVRALR